MVTINLRWHYPHNKEDIYVEITEEMYEAIRYSIRQENNYVKRKYYHNAQYSLDFGDGIETRALYNTPSPEELLIQKVTLEQLHEALNAIPPIQARRVYALYIEKQKKVEIARAEGVHESGVRDSIIRGLVNLQKYYAKKGWHI